MKVSMGTADPCVVGACLLTCYRLCVFGCANSACNSAHIWGGLRRFSGATEAPLRREGVCQMHRVVVGSVVGYMWTRVLLGGQGCAGMKQGAPVRPYEGGL